MGLLLAPAEGLGLRPRTFFRGKKELIILFWPILGYLLCLVVTLVTFSRNLSNFKKNPRNTKNQKKSQKNSNKKKIKKAKSIKKKPKKTTTKI